MVSCASCGCSLNQKRKDSSLTFHKFPKDEKRRAAWIQFVNKPEFSPKPSSVLCSHHFAENYFDRTSKIAVKLLPNAIPTIEVERLKFVRTYNPIVTRPSECVANTLKDSDILLSNGGPSSQPELSSIAGPSFMPRLSVREQTPGTSVRGGTDVPSVGLEETPCERILKRKISELQELYTLRGRKIRALQKRNCKLKKKISSLKSLTMELKKKNLLSFEHEDIMIQHFGKNKAIIGRLLKKSQKRKVCKTYEHSVRAFAVSLHFFSPKAYNYIRQTFENCLPHPKTLAKWYASIDAKPGFTSEALNFLKLKIQNSDKNLFCSLVFDEMAIRKQLEYVGIQYYGYVDCGTDLHGDSMDLANEALVFMLVCINEPWKIPIGYFFIAGMNSQQKVSLLKQALTLLKDVGVRITNITFDGCAANFSLCNILNCNSNRSDIKVEFLFENSKYFLLPDPAHVLKLN